MQGNNLYRREKSDYTNQGIVLYAPPFEWQEKEGKSFGRVSKLLKLADISGRFLMSPSDSCGKGSQRAKSLEVRGYALDNGAYTYYKKNQPFDDTAFVRMVERFGFNADWIVIPDVVFDAQLTLKLASKWIPILKKIHPKSRLLFVWQDGMTVRDLVPFASKGVGIFVGGSVEGKFKNLHDISGLCLDYRVWLHVGRVNSIKRIKTCKAFGVCSFDGSGYTRYSHQLNSVHKFLMQEQRQINLFRSKNSFCSTVLGDWIK